jgi:hypothetical protein
MIVCDGCGEHADDAHVRARIERLELATRFRPIHIHTLLMDAAPPSSPEDYFYAVSADRSQRSVGSRVCFDELMKCAGFASDAAIQEELALAEFQRKGLFLASAIECPIRAATDLEAAVQKAAPTVVQRVKASYKPRHIVLLSEAARGLIGPLSDAGWRDRLILESDGPFVDPFLSDPAAQAEFATGFGVRLANALRHTS